VNDAISLGDDAFNAFNVVGLQLDFRTPAPEAERVVASFRRRLPEGTTRLVYFDGDDDLGIQWPAVLRLVDLYVKKHVFADADAYLKTYIGKSNLTDYVASRNGISFTSNIIPSSGGHRPEDLRKVHLGWNIGLDNKIVELFERLPRPQPAEKDNDIVCRATVPIDNWIFPLRDVVLKVLEPVKDRFRILLPNQRVSQEKYYQEMRRSRICISPFGYGEICWRDFEAVVCGCLVIKPDMGHVRTNPDIFVPGETYVPVRWDYADLVEKCEYYLNHETERARIADHAYVVLAESYQKHRLVATFAELLDRIEPLPSLPLAGLKPVRLSVSHQT
jgi:hypothetical protein